MSTVTHHIMTFDWFSSVIPAYVFACPECGRRLEYDFTTGKKVILEEGTSDPFTTTHSGTTENKTFKLGVDTSVKDNIL